jgi:hypothetical protein
MRSLAAPLSLGLLLACSSSSGGGLSPSSFATQYCALLDPCCADAGLSTSGQQCTELIAAAGSAETFNASSAQACLDAMKTASTQPGFCSGDLSASSCNGVFSSSSSSGTTAPGQPCTQDGNCAPAAGSGGNATCLFAPGADGGSAQVCVQTLPGHSGQGPCIGTQSGTETTYGFSGPPPSLGYVCDVADGLTCSSTTQKCEAPATKGEACSADSDCTAADYCDFSGTSNTCTPRVSDGAACSLGGAECVPTAYCDTTSQTCVPALASGAACSTSGSGTPCQTGLYCVNGTCGGSSTAGLSLICGS